MFARIQRVGAYAYLQWVRTEQRGGPPRQRVLATLGRVEHLQRRRELDGLLRSLSPYSPQALALVCGPTPPTTRTWKLGPVRVYERLWQRLGLGEILNGLLAGRQFGFAVERAIFVTVRHRLCVAGSDRQAEQRRQGYWLPGKSKDHRPDLRQMVVGVVLDQSGQPVFGKNVLAGRAL
jgi:hypothetical protein